MIAKPLTLTLSRRERGLTESAGRCTPTCDFSDEPGLAKPEFALIFQVDISRKITSP
jgi:hypothetical protein